jgi:Uma2 family endonuclease
MTLDEHIYSVAEFDEFVQLPENENKLFEFIGGEIFEVPSNPYVSKIAITIAAYIRMYTLQQDIGHVTGEAGGYIVSGERYAPDVAFIRYEKQQELVKEGYNPNPPDLAVEVVSSDSKAENEKLTIKLGNYLAAATVVWIVRPEKKSVEVHQSGLPVRTLREKDSLDGGDILPGLTIPVSAIFK